MPSAPTFHVVSGSAVRRIIEDHRWQIFGTVDTAYRLHASGNTLNPDSYFLRYPHRPSARIIALPAHLGWPTVWVGPVAQSHFGPRIFVACRPLILTAEHIWPQEKRSK